MQKKANQEDKKEVKRKRIKAFPVSDEFKDYDKEFYEWLNKNYRNLNEDELEKIKNRARKSEKVLNAVKKFIEKNWKSNSDDKRMAAASLIEFFELEEYVDKLVVLSFDGWILTYAKARKVFEKLFGKDVEIWLGKEENREKVVNSVKKFVDEEWKSLDSNIKLAVASLIEFFELEEHYDKLIELSFDGHKNVIEKARQSLNKIGLEGFKEYLDSLSKEKRKELKKKFESYFKKNRYELTVLIKDCSPLLVLGAI